MLETDWHGRQIPDGETPETIIKWWEVDPHPTRPGYVLHERSWQAMLRFVGMSLDCLLEQDDVEENGCTLKFRVVEGTLHQYLEEMWDDSQ